MRTEPKKPTKPLSLVEELEDNALPASGIEMTIGDNFKEAHAHDPLELVQRVRHPARRY